MKSLATPLCLLPLLLLLAPGCDRSPSPPPAPAASTGTGDDPAALALARGPVVVARAFSLMSSNLSQAIAAGGYTNALRFCSAVAIPLTQTVAASNQVSLRRVSHKPRNPAAHPTPEEQAVLDRFQSTLSTGGKPVPIVLSNQPTTLSFFAPIVLTNALCLNCHGLPDTDIQPATLAVLRATYPSDQATGFRLGDLRGMWRVDFPRDSLLP